jgi:hypothetical protein
MGQIEKLTICEPHVFQAPLLGPARVIDSALKDIMLDVVKRLEPKPKDLRTRQFISLKCGMLVFTTKLSIFSVKGFPEQLKVSTFRS